MLVRSYRKVTLLSVHSVVPCDSVADDSCVYYKTIVKWLVLMGIGCDEEDREYGVAYDGRCAEWRLRRR